MSETNSPPVIEVAINVDAGVDYGQRVDAVVVIIDGIPLDPARYTVVTNGKESASRVSLREDAWERTREGSAAYTTLLDLWHGSAEDNARNNFTTVAKCVQPGIARAVNLFPALWKRESEPGTTTRKAAYAALPVAVFHSPGEDGDSAEDMLDYALELYSMEIPDKPGYGFADLLTDLFTGIRHLAEAYGIRLESEPAPNALLARDLRAMLAALRDAARGRSAELIAEAGTTLEQIEYRAFLAFLADCTDA